MNKRWIALVSTAVLGAALLVAGQSSAQVKQGKTRPLTTHDLMAGLVAPHTGSLREAFKGDGPADDKGWATARIQAGLLNEASYTMMEDGRCPDQVWAGACKELAARNRRAAGQDRGQGRGRFSRGAHGGHRLLQELPHRAQEVVGSASPVRTKTTRPLPREE